MKFDVKYRYLDKEFAYKNVDVYTDINNEHLDMVDERGDSGLRLFNIKVEFKEDSIFVIGYSCIYPAKSHFERVQLYLTKNEE